MTTSTQPIRIAIGNPPKQKSAAVCVHLVAHAGAGALSDFLKLLRPLAVRLSQLIDDELASYSLAISACADWRTAIADDILLEVHWQTNDWFPKGDVSWLLDTLDVPYFLWVRNAKWDIPTYSVLMNCGGQPYAEMTTEDDAFAKLLSRPVLHSLKSTNAVEAIRTLNLLCKSFMTPYLAAGVPLNKALQGTDGRVALQSRACSKFVYSVIDFVRQYLGPDADSLLAKEGADRSWVLRFNVAAGPSLQSQEPDLVEALNIIAGRSKIQQAIPSVVKSSVKSASKI